MTLQPCAVDKIAPGTWYCPLPFKHAFLDSTGVAACCQTPRQQVAIKDWANNPYLQQLQTKIISGTVPLECQGCVNQERVQGRSLRTDSLRDYDYQRFTSTDIDFVDYRSNNICNFKCRTCEPAFSHGIAKEARDHPPLHEFFQIIDNKTVSVTEENSEWLYNNIDVIKRLMITGGEPTVMPEIKKIVERVVYDQLDIELLITTNGSFVDDFWCEATRLHNKIHWTVSIDAVGTEAESIRYGTKWSVVERNLKWLAQHASSLNINTVVSNLNVLHLKPLLEFVLEIQRESQYPRGKHGEKGCRHQFHVCQRPYRLSANNWPVEMQPVVKQHLQECLELPIDFEQSAMLVGLLASITQANFDPRLWDQSQRYNQELDKIRT
jgi:sulfatase maturation enzyme AslB (radical SAM superfamily)